MPYLVHRSIAALTSALLLASCSSGTPSGPPPAVVPVATRLAFTTAPGAEVEQLVDFTAAPVVEVLNAAGSRVTGSTASVTLTLNGGPTGASLRGTRVVTAVNGIVTFAGLTIDSIGSGYTVTATSPALTSVTSSAFTVRATPLALSVVNGNAQTGAAGAALAQPIRIRMIRSPGGPPQPGRRVRFTVSGGGSITPVEATTNASGEAEAVWTLGASGAQAGRATVIGGTGEFTEFSAGIASATLSLTALSSGGASSCGIAVGGTLLCWGLHLKGQLGDGSGSSPGFAVRPVRVVTPPVLTRVSVGAEHACGLTADGTAFCWGEPGMGRLGIGTVDGTPRRFPVAVSTTVRFRSIAAGGSHTCALAADSAAYCWGANQGGQVGDGQGGPNAASALTPVAVAGGLRFVALATGQNSSCGLTSAGAVFCWGDNTSGQLGEGSRIRRLQPFPVSLPTGAVVTTIASGSNHACAVLQDLRALCWGINRFGTLGDGGSTNNSLPVVVTGGLQFRAITAGAAHTCAILTNHTGVCWGNNSTAQLGSGSSPSGSGSTPLSLVPVPINGALSYEVISAGGQGTCAIERGTARAVCWGNTSNGQLGNGVSVAGEELTPVPVLPPLSP